jgi:hypothetical protein
VDMKGSGEPAATFPLTAKGTSQVSAC